MDGNTWSSSSQALYVRSRKSDTLVDELELTQANAYYAYIRYPDSWETTVTAKQLTPKPRPKSPHIQVQLKRQGSKTMSVVPKD